MSDDTLRLRVQAWLDGELPPRQAAVVLRLTETDPEAARVAAELKWVRSCLAVGEAPRFVPEDRAFYWSKIERAIQRAAAAPETRVEVPAVSLWWLRWLVPAGVLAAVALVVFTAKSPPPQNAALAPAEIDSPQGDLGTITFRSDSEQMTVVWVGNP